jgi:ATP-binding cassette ChvD family protein
MALLSIQRVRTSFGGPPLLDSVSLQIEHGERVCLLGRNGTGKSTLMKCIAGELVPDSGEIVRQQDIRISFLPQEVPQGLHGTVFDLVASGLGKLGDTLTAYQHASTQLAQTPGEHNRQLLARLDRLQHSLDTTGGWLVHRQVEQILSHLDLDPSAPFASLSGGLKRRTLLAAALVSDPDLLLLDEPTNHLDAESVAWLERFLADYRGTVVAVTHDRYFLDNVAGWILELDRGAGIPWEGNYSSWLAQKQQRFDVEAKHEAKRRRTLQRELEWIAMSPRARQAKGKARLNAYERLLAEDSAQKIDSVEIYVPPGPRLGDVVVEATDLIKGYGDRALIGGLSFTLPPAGIVGVVGPNGSGKTTLLRLITGEEEPDAGEIRLGDTVQLGYVDQSRALDPQQTVWEAISDGLDEITLAKRTVASRAYVSWFNFRGGDQQRKVGALSGGERNRVHLARLLRGGANLLLLDEPTNDLDVDTLRALEDAVVEFAGCAVVVSHDRWFLDRIATHIIAFEGDSEVVWFAGNYADYEADRRRRFGRAADQPHRIRFRKLTRA